MSGMWALPRRAWAMRSNKATPEQHAALDAEYEAILEAMPNIWAQLGIYDMWGKEKEYRSRYGERYPVIVNIKVPS